MSSPIQTIRSSRRGIGLQWPTLTHGFLLLLIVGLCGVSLDNPNTKDLLTANGFNIEIFGNPSAEFRKLYKLNLTPLTIVIDSQRNVEKVWAGAFNENTKAEMETYFGISRDGVK